VIDFQAGIDRVEVSGTPKLTYTDTADGHILVTWGDPDADVLLLGVSAGEFT
jgi:hypothetical protein